MKSFSPFYVKVPGSTANLGPGFDSIGMAVNCFLTLYLEPAARLDITVGGKHSSGISVQSDNFIVQVMRKLFEKEGVEMPPFHLHIKNDIPLARGLGSSAAAIVAGLLAADHLLETEWSQKELLKKATILEGHPDNVGASLFGGIVISSWDGKEVEVATCEPPDIPVITIIPEQRLSTGTARKALPEDYSRHDAVLSSSRANLLVAALFLKKWDLLKTAMQDAFHQPYREMLVPGLKEGLKKATDHGAYGIALSGAGPTMIAFVKDKVQLKKFFYELFSNLQVSVEMLEMTPCHTGAHIVLTAEEKHSKFMGKI
ncbi:homoserine kinase [Thermoactinomyces mirandus]|uniref:Homoserine kinase n=1 Tax=Thermoactinomyces mirandus TaxID=2756294 RepID=A0A7W1XT00_9BACL|nr:homoserine kinase [Thermoactinomyces mirandus]MBA4602733.1 homoserine kinase [Thermoactinomyces mirandus]